MDKKTFIELMTELVSIKKAEDNLNDALKRFEPDSSRLSFGRYETLVFRSLELAMNDKYHWISHWIYDCDMGKKYMTVRVDGKKKAFKSLSDLFNVIKTDNYYPTD